MKKLLLTSLAALILAAACAHSKRYINVESPEGYEAIYDTKNFEYTVMMYTNHENFKVMETSESGYKSHDRAVKLVTLINSTLTLDDLLNIDNGDKKITQDEFWRAIWHKYGDNVVGFKYHDGEVIIIKARTN